MEKRTISKLKPAKYNPRQITKSQMEKLSQSIKEFGFIEPVVINKDNTIIGGHQRVKAAEALGMADVPVVVVNIPKGKEKALNIALNRISGEWDEDKLKELLNTLTEAEQALTGFEEAELAEMLEQAQKVEEDDYESAPPEEPQSKLGDIYQLGDHRLMCGDATKKDDVDKLMDGKTADMAWTDPPYNVDYEGGTGLKIQNDDMGEEDFRRFLHDSFKNFWHVLGGGCPIYIAHASSEADNFMQSAKNAGLNITQTLIWVKNRLVLGRQDYQWRHEPILYGWKPGAAHRWYGGYKQTTVIDDSVDFKKWKKEKLVKVLEEFQTTILHANKPNKNKQHPTMKPLGLINQAIQNSSEIGNIIIDFFGGSGSTMMACEQTKRKCYMMELDPQYVDVIIDRWEELTGGMAKKL